jgi:hypothetical protein
VSPALWTHSRPMNRTMDQCRALTEVVKLGEHQLPYWQERWVKEVIEMQRRLQSNKHRYYTLRTIGLAAGVIVPALVGSNLSGAGNMAVRLTTLILSIVAAISIALSELLRAGERWRINRKYLAIIYGEGVQFATLTGAYDANESHNSAIPHFSVIVEQLIQAYEAEYQQEVLSLDHILDHQRKWEGVNGS